MGNLEREFQILRADIMTKNKRSQTAIPHQDMRILSCFAWFSSPRGTAVTKNNRRERTQQQRRIVHGIARAIENLRGMRMSLVPRPDTCKCLLPGLRSKAEGLSVSREPETSRASSPQATDQSVENG
jgi:hypothetical protein